MPNRFLVERLWAKGKVALVTGATSGIGRASAEHFAAAGARVVVVGRNEERGVDCVKGIVANGGQALFVSADVRVEADNNRMVEAALTEFGRLDVACNSAGVSLTSVASGILDMEFGHWEDTIAANLTGTWLSMKAEIAAMLEVGAGAIVNVSSVAATHGSYRAAAYSSSKGGLHNHTRSAAREFGAQDIRVNAVIPGMIETPMLNSVLALQPERRQPQLDQTPMARIGTPCEAACAIEYLCSPFSSYVTGALLTVDGGLVA